MKQKKTPKPNAMRLLEKEGVAYDVFTYPWKEDALDALHAQENLRREQDDVYKTLLCVGDKTGPLVAVIPAKAHIDLKKLGRVSGNKRVEMLPLKELEKTTGYIRGGCSPLAMKRLYPTILDDSARQFDIILVSAGQRGLQVGLAPQALLQVTKGQFYDITQNEEMHTS